MNLKFQLSINERTADTQSDNSQQPDASAQLDHESRTRLLVDLGLQQVGRSRSFTEQLNAKILSSFQNFLVILSLEIPIIVYFQQAGKITGWDWVLLALWLGSSILAMVIFTQFVWPQKYADTDLFSKTRFEDLCEASTLEILSDHLDALRTCDNKNLEVYEVLKDEGIVSFQPLPPTM